MAPSACPREEAQPISTSLVLTLLTFSTLGSVETPARSAAADDVAAAIPEGGAARGKGKWYVGIRVLPDVTTVVWTEFDSETDAQKEVKSYRLLNAPNDIKGLWIQRGSKALVPTRSDLSSMARTLTDERHRDTYRPRGGVTHCSQFVRDFARGALGRDVPELRGRANDQFAQLRASPDVERLWAPDASDPNLVAARTALQEARRLEAERKAAQELNDTARSAELTEQVGKARERAREKAAGLSRALAAAQERANRGNLVVVAWDNPRAEGHGHIAVVTPSPEGGPTLRPSGDWGLMRLPYIAQAGTTVFAEQPLSSGFRSVETIEGLGVFVLKNP